MLYAVIGISDLANVCKWFYDDLGSQGKPVGKTLGPRGCCRAMISETTTDSVLMQAALSAIITSIRGIGENKGGMTLTRCHLVELIPQTKQNEASFEVQVRWEGEPNAID